MPVHHLFVGTWTPPGAIFTFAFDDVARTLSLVQRTAVAHDEPLSWMAFSHDKKTLYGAAGKKWSSYRVLSPTALAHQASLPLSHDARARDAAASTRAIFLVADPSPPHAVYCHPFYAFADSASVFAVDARSGALLPPPAHAEPLRLRYAEGSAVHAAAFHPDGRHLFSADWGGNCVWVHRRRRPGRPALDPVAAYPAPAPADRPRWLAVHPAGALLYVLMESGNRVCEYDIVAAGPGPGPHALALAFSGRAFDLVPDTLACAPADVLARAYRADVCALAHSASYLFASTRASCPGQPGFLAAFGLRPDGPIDRRLVLRPTPTTGGHSNAVSPCDWSDQWLAVVEDHDGRLDIYRWSDETLELVAGIRLPDEPGFGMNVLWYD